MNIISTFMFSEPHEADLLFFKLMIENPFVTKWVIIENSYTFQGSEKKLFLESVLSEDRFQIFKEKIHVIIITRNYNIEYEPPLKEILKRRIKRFINKQKRYDRYHFVSYAELASFHCEINQRQAAVEYIQNNFQKDDLIFTGDTDEILDLNCNKYKTFLEIMQTNQTPVYFYRKVFCYDFDNYSNRVRYSPIIRVSDLIDENYSLHFYRHNPKKNIIQTDDVFFFEYTFCFDKNSIIKKLSSFAHVSGLNDLAVQFCLDNNIALKSRKMITPEDLNNPEFFYEKEVLSEKNSPLYIRENIDKLRLNTVAVDYKVSRVTNHIEQLF